jgi:hypothetical protein
MSCGDPCPSNAPASTAINSQQTKEDATDAKPPGTSNTQKANAPNTQATTNNDPNGSETTPPSAGYATKAQDPTTLGLPTTSTQKTTRFFSQRIVHAILVAANQS